jgi:hypothetical protein
VCAKFREIIGTKFHEISRNKFKFRIKFRTSRNTKIDFRIHPTVYEMLKNKFYFCHNFRLVGAVEIC